MANAEAFQAYEAGQQLARSGKRCVPPAHSQFWHNPALRRAYKTGYRAAQREVEAETVALQNECAAPDMRHPSDMTMETRRCCGVVAVAVLAGVSLAEARRALRKAVAVNRGQRAAASWRGGGTTHAERWSALIRLGKHPVEVALPRRMTLAQFARRCLQGDAERRYMVTTTGHVQIVKGDRRTDQHGVDTKVAGKGSRKRVMTVVYLEGD